MCVYVCGEMSHPCHSSVIPVISLSILCHIPVTPLSYPCHSSIIPVNPLSHPVTPLSGQSEEGDEDGHHPILTYANVHSRVQSLVQKVSALKGAVKSNQALLASRIEEL